MADIKKTANKVRAKLKGKFEIATSLIESHWVQSSPQSKLRC
jgi:hypothetical protein